MENVHNADETAPGPETTQISVSDIAIFDPLESAQPFAKYLIFLNWFDGETQWVIGRFWSLFLANFAKLVQWLVAIHKWCWPDPDG